MNEIEQKELFEQNALKSLEKYKARFEMWDKDHENGLMPPVIQDKAGTYHWMNRAERRAMAKQARSKKNRKA